MALRKVKLSARLEAVAKMVPQGTYLADVGSDHAYLPISLIQRGIISYAQAIENKMGPFLRMQGNVDDAGLSSHIDVSLSDGLDKLNDGVQTLCLCGLGGMLTCQILEKNLDKLDNIKTIICDPHHDLVAVREKISALGYHISDEKMVYENKIYYTIIRFDKGDLDKPYNYHDLHFGPIARRERSQVFLDWIEINRKAVGEQLNKNLSPERKEAYLRLYRALASEAKGTASK